MAQWIKELAAKLEGLSLNPQVTWWKERTDSCKLSFDLHIHVPWHRGIHTATPPLTHVLCKEKLG